MDEQAGLHASEEKLEDGAADVRIQIKSAIDEFELPHAAIQELIERLQEEFERCVADWHIKRGQAELAGEWTAARRLDIDHAMGDIVRIVKIVRQLQIGERWRLRVDQLHQRPFAAQQAATEIGEFEIRFPCYREVRLLNDCLLFAFVADFGTTQNNNHPRGGPLEDADEFGHRGDVPDVNTQPENSWLPRENRLGHVDRALGDIELGDLGSRSQFAEVRVQIAQPERGVGVTGVERTQQNLGHAGIIAD